MKRLFAAAACLAALSAGMLRAAEPVDMQKRTAELKNLRWGMFICWSFSTFSGKEWTPGVKDVSFFKATDCDTDQWARTAKEAGMGYILFLTKHHDAFCLWDTKTTDRKVTKAAMGRDVLAELRKSCDKYGIKLALYFSEGEFGDNRNYHPGGYTPAMKKAQLKELLTQYGPIEYIWMDHAQTDGGLSHEETVKWCKQFQPGCFIGFNNGPAAGDIRLGEMGHPAPLADVSGAGFNAGHMQGYHGYRLAEFTYPILPAHQGGAQWFYSLPKHDRLCFSAEKLYADYRGAVKYGNIFSIDVGPDYAGKLRAIDVDTLRKVGAMINNPPPVPLSQDKPARASSIWGPGYEADKAVDGDEISRWGAERGARSGWLEIDLGKETPIGRAVIMETAFPRTREFAIEYKNNEQWKPLYRGTTINGRHTYVFSPVNARYVRLNIIKADEVPTIEEFQVCTPSNNPYDRTPEKQHR
jgi:alpha-L-fucosidase